MARGGDRHGTGPWQMNARHGTLVLVYLLEYDGRYLLASPCPYYIHI